ncbi:amino acid adenylation domain-containing protein [Micromonospora pisi]|uniref:Phenyloxazoline synthase MbtB n=1 Tax=Micromonospora pisi TaxID=589240 RepID=A0A495JJ42_9ACTN|nr:non-ribosomal peptide synthetase [Micromonospora pisi]RKR88342.1 amino acid adenylation domain-containing protein [Micromonospora pisi]
MNLPLNPEAALDDVLDCIAEVLGTDPGLIDTETPLTALGLESFTAVRLRRRIRERTGHDLPLTAFLDNATALDLARQLSRFVEPTSDPSSTSTQPDDSLVFALTPIQESYLVGREAGLVLGGVATFYYYEYDRITDDAVADLDRLEVAWNRLVSHHSMLRMVADHRGRGRVLPSVGPYRIGVTDLRDASPAKVDEELAALRHDRSHQVRPAGQWPLFDLHAAFLPEGRTRLYVGVDVLVTDMAGWMLLMRQWGQLVADPAASLPVPPADFTDLLRGRAADPEWAERRVRDQAYWATRVAELPPAPRLPVTRAADSTEPPRFVRHAGGLETGAWRELRARCGEHGVTPTAALLAAFAVILSRWGAGDQVCLNTTLFDRPESPEGIDLVVGDFTTTALVGTPRCDPSSWSGFAGYAADLNRRFWEDLDHRSVSGVEVLRQLDRTAGPPPYPVVFTSGVGLAGDKAEAPASWLGEEVFGVSQTPQVLLDHIVWDEAGALRIAWDGVVGAFPEGYLRDMLDAYLRLLHRLTEAAAWKDPTLGWDPFVLPTETLDVEPFPDAGPLLHDPVTIAAHRVPEHPALYAGSGTTSHGRLAENVAATAGALGAAGVGAGDLVAVACEKGPAQIAAVLAVNAVGAGYLPVEPSWPDARVAAICARAGVRHALVGRGVRTAWPEGVTPHRLTAVGRPSARPEVSASPPTTPPRPQPDAGSTAYVIFTSGSTGHPKGVEIQHRAARTTIDDIVDRFGVHAGDRVLALSALSFDLSVFDIYGVLGAGGALILPDPARQRDPQHWLELADRHGITIWNTAPALLEMLVEYAEIEPEAAGKALRTLRLVMLSGDWIPLTLPDRLRRLAPQARVMSLGGATEASIWSITYPVGEVDLQWRSIPYGRALRAQSFHILDPNGAPCPVGEPGELFIGGDGLASGYVGDPEQTAQRFATHPVLGERLYRTGDLGRWRQDGNIEFLGRVDRQVKVRGHRIELGEIEATLSRHPGLRQCVVAAVPGPDERPRLVAYVVPKAGQPTPPIAELTETLRERLPDYMVPNRFLVLESLPVTPNGKIDHAALPNPYRTVDDSSDDDIQPSPPPATPPVRTPLSSASNGPDWVGPAITEAAALGLEIGLVVHPGRLSPSQALVASARWLERVHLGTGAYAANFVERIPVDGVIELVPRSPNPVPTAGTPPTRQPAAVAEPAVTAPEPSAQKPADGGVTKGARPTDPSVTEAVIAVLSDLTGEPVHPDSTFAALGATSLTLVLSHRRLHEGIAPRLALADMFGHATVASLAAHITSLTPNQGPRTHEPLDNSTQPSTRRSSRLAARTRAQEVDR